MREPNTEERMTFHASRITYHSFGPHIGCVLPVFVKNAFNFSRHRIVFDNHAHFSAAIQAHRADVLTADEEPAAVHNNTLRVQLVSSEFAHMIVGYDLIVGGIFADNLDVA